MNIFKALSQGDGSINETNVTSFLSYVFSETNEFSSEMILLFLGLIKKDLSDSFLNTILNSEKTFRQQANDFSNKFCYEVVAEKRFKDEHLKRDTDIYIRIFNKIDTKEKDVCYLLIENKIKKSAISDVGQCVKQYELFRHSDEYQQETPVYSVLITPDLPNFAPMLDEVKKVNNNSVWLRWDSEKNISTISSIFIKLIELESTGKIAPINNNTQYIIKSFIDFMSTSELSVSNGKVRNISIGDSKISSEASYTLNDKEFSLKRYENKMIRIFDSENEMLDISVKPELRKIVKEYKLDIDLTTNTGYPKNTQTLGQEVIETLSKRR